MVAEAIIEQIKTDFQFLSQNPNVLGVILYGSHVSETATPKSDIDICIVSPHQDLYQMFTLITHHLKNNIEKYDIRFFEELPLYIQGEIIENGIIILCPDEPTLFEYFFKFRKLWEDQKYKLRLLIS